MKLKSMYVCSNCGYESAKWLGKCPSCNSWNTMNEEVRETMTAASKGRSTSVDGSNVKSVQLSAVSALDLPRLRTGIDELDRVLGGGIVAGELVLLSGDPGIGKSTILLQMCGNLGKERRILYVSGEESAHQIKMRADRLGVDCPDFLLSTETDAAAIIAQIETEKPDVVIIDSIQTISLSELSSSTGSVTQVRECTNLFMRTAKSTQIPIFLVGHVNKDGAIAGPKVMEHIVDAVLYFEGERNLAYRILRTVKNRFGSTNEIGVFEMAENGLREVPNPSAAMLSGRPVSVSGSCVCCLMEGSRPILTEVQALVSPAGYGNARRMATGFDYNRCAMLLAVLEKRCGYRFAEFDTYLNVVGGLKLDEPAADLSVCLALASGLTDRPLPEDLIAFGEVGLAGELRSVSYTSMRIAEAARLGFTACIVPSQNQRSMKSLQDSCPEGFKIYQARDLASAIRAALAIGKQK
ncbi:MAG: DNA repair protein RadA [Clostridia bacterium]|nr:DNA repair protein RadA [Clostridia bacterium]